MELPTPASATGETYLLIGLGAFTLALPLISVRSVDRPGRFTAVPFAAPWLRGVTAVAGDVVSVVDLGVFAGGTPAGMSPGARLVVAGHGPVVAGLLVDRVVGLATAAGPLSPAPVASGPLAPCWRGALTVDGEVAFVVDPQRLFESPAFHSYQAPSSPTPSLTATGSTFSTTTVTAPAPLAAPSNALSLE